MAHNKDTIIANNIGYSPATDMSTVNDFLHWSLANTNAIYIIACNILYHTIE